MSQSTGPTDATAVPTPDQWTIRRLLQWIASALAERGVESPKLLADLLLTHTLGCDRMHLYTHSDQQASPQQLETLRTLVRRALKHEPIQYLVGEAWFLGLRLSVDRRVLIPRPATETLVEELLQDARRRGLLAERPREKAAAVERAIRRDYAKARAEAGLGDESEPDQSQPSPTAAHPPLLIADIGTGSGAIALAILHTASNARVLASDLSDDALAVAQANARALNLIDRLTLKQGNLTAPVRPWLAAEHPAAGGLDYLVSNPPYIPDHEWNTPGLVDPNVKGHEPESALRGGPDGLEFVRPIIEAAPSLLKPGGTVLIEIAAATADTTIELASHAGLREARVINDLDNLPRVLIAHH